MKKTILMIVVAVLIAGVSGGGVYLWQSSNLKNTEQSLQQQITALKNKIVSQQNIAEPNNNTVVDETAGWKTYTQAEYGYSFKYPVNATVNDNVSVITIDTDVQSGIYSIHEIQSVGKNVAGGKSLEDWANDDISYFAYYQKAKESDISITDTTVGGKPAKKIVAKNISSYGNTHVIVIYNNNKGNDVMLTIFGDTSSPSNETNFNAFLNSFEFIK